MGDTNCDLFSGSSDSNSKQIQPLYQLFIAKQIINEPTRVTLTSYTLTSLLFIFRCLYSRIRGAHKVSLNDNYMVFCKRKLNSAVYESHKLVITGNMKYFNEESFLTDISSSFWEIWLTELMTLLQWLVIGQGG